MTPLLSKIILAIVTGSPMITYTQQEPVVTIQDASSVHQYTHECRKMEVNVEDVRVIIEPRHYTHTSNGEKLESKDMSYIQVDTKFGVDDEYELNVLNESESKDVVDALITQGFIECKPN